MQCPNCNYISFKQEKECGSCGFSFKGASLSSESLFRNESFSIFSQSQAPAKQESSGEAIPQAADSIAVAEPPKEKSPELEKGEFLLNLSDAEKEKSETNLKSDSSDQKTTDFSSMDLGTDASINLEEMEVEGLGLGLEPIEIEEEASISATSDTDSKTAEDSLEPEIEISETPEMAEQDQENIDLKIDGLNDSTSEEQIEINPPEDDTVLKVNEIGDSDETVVVEPESAEEGLTITPDINLNEEDEPEAPVLDLGNDDVSLDMSEEPKPLETTTPPAESEEFEIKLEIDDSEGPLTISKEETPEIEIEDLGLELEDKDSPSDPNKT